MSSYMHRELPALAAVKNSVADLQYTFTHPEHGLLAGRSEQCEVLGLDGVQVSSEDIGAAITRAARSAEDLLVVYYAGHGILDDDGALHLAVTNTDPDHLDYTAVCIDTIKRQLARAKARARVLLLDCCFSGRAIPLMAARRDLIVGQLQVSGTYILTSTAANKTSRAVPVKPGDRQTVFAAALLRALNAPEALTLDGIYEHIRDELDQFVLPPPQRGATGDVALVGLARGPVPLPTGHPDPPAPTVRRRQTLIEAVAASAAASVAVGALILLTGDSSAIGNLDSSRPTASPSASATPPRPPTTTTPRPTPGTATPGKDHSPDVQPAHSDGSLVSTSTDLTGGGWGSGADSGNTSTQGLIGGSSTNGGTGTTNSTSSSGETNGGGQGTLVGGQEGDTGNTSGSTAGGSSPSPTDCSASNDGLIGGTC